MHPKIKATNTSDTYTRESEGQCNADPTGLVLIYVHAAHALKLDSLTSQLAKPGIKPVQGRGQF